MGKNIIILFCESCWAIRRLVDNNNNIIEPFDVDIFPCYSDDKVKLSYAQEVIVESTIMTVCGIVLC